MIQLTFRSIAIVALTCTALLLVNGCKDSTDNEIDRLFSEIEIPTEDEARARAVEQITPENVDEEFDRLEREILADDEF